MAAAPVSTPATSVPALPAAAGGISARNDWEARHIPGRRKAAILLAALGDEASAMVLRNLSEEEVHDVTRELSVLTNVPEEDRIAVLKEFLAVYERPDLLAAGGMDYVTSILLSAFGPETGKRMADRLLKSMGTDMPSVDSLRKADPEHLANVLHREHPQTTALVLCHLGTSNAAQLLSALPQQVRPDVVRRMAALDQVSPEIVNRIARSIGRKLRVAGESSLESFGGVRAVAEVLNRVDAAATEEILVQISGDNPALGETIRQLMFVFDDLMNVSPEALRAIVSRIDRKLLTMALKGCNAAQKRQFTGQMSARAAEMLNEDMQALGPVRIRDVEDAQQKIIAIARQMQTEGLISLQSAANEKFVD